MGDEVTWLQWLLSGEKLVGLLLAVFGVIAGGISWFWKRVSGRVSQGVSGVALGQERLTNWVKQVEKDVKGVQNDLEKMKTRIGGMETSIASLATSKEVAQLDRHLAALSAQVQAQNTTTRMLYEAAMRADTSGGRS